MGSELVVVSLPAFDSFSGVSQAREPMKVQAVLAALAVEAFHEGIARRFSRLDELKFDAASLRPQEHGL